MQTKPWYWCFVLLVFLILVEQHNGASLDVDWIKQHPAEAFDLFSKSASLELDSNLDISELTFAQGTVNLYCAAGRKIQQDERTFKSEIFSTIQFKGDTKAYKLLFDVPLGEQRPFDATLERAFAINNEFIISKREFLQRKTEAEESPFMEYQQMASTQTTTRRLTRVFGPQRILWIRSIFNDTTPAVGWPTASQSVWESIQMLDTYFKQYSYNQLWVDFEGSNVTQVYTMSFNRSDVDTGRISAESLGKAGFDGYREADYDFIIFSFPTVDWYWWAGVAVVYGKLTWINAYSTSGIADYVLLHELGHNIGLGHSNNLISAENPKVSFGGNGNINDYGDLFDNMGAGGVKSHWNFIKKQKIGWVNETMTRNISLPYSGYIELNAFDQEVSFGKLMAIYLPWNIVMKPNILFCLTYRSQSTASKRIQLGAIEVRAAYKFYRTLDAYETNGTHLIDTTPTSPADRDDAMITLGQTYFEKGGYPNMIISAISAKCNPNTLNSTSCVVKGYLHFGKPLVTNSYNISIFPLDVDRYNTSYNLAIWSDFRLVVDVSASDPSQESIYFLDLGWADTFSAQGHWGNFMQTDRGVRKTSFTVSNMKGTVQSKQFDIAIVQGRNYGEAWCDGPFDHTQDLKAFRPIVDRGIAEELYVVVNEDLLGTALRTRQAYFYFPVNTTSGLYRFHTIAVDTDLAIGTSGFKFMYMNRMENNMQFNLIRNSTTNATIAVNFLTPKAGMFLHRLVTISQRSVTKMGSKQNTAQYQRLSDYEIWINGTGSVNILYPYTVTNKTIVEFEVKSSLLGRGGHYFSLQQTLQHNTNWYIEILPCISNCNYTNNTSTYYAKTNLMESYSLISIPIYNEYLKTKDHHMGLYASFTNANGGEMTIRRIRFYESTSLLPTLCSDSNVRNSVIDYGSRSLQYVWKYQGRNNSLVNGTLTSSLPEGPIITGVSLNETIDVNLRIVSSGNTIFDQTVALKYTSPVYETVGNTVVPVHSSPRIAPRYSSSRVAPRYSSASIRNSTTPIAQNSTSRVIATNSSSIVSPVSSILARNSTAPRQNPTGQTSTNIISAAGKQTTNIFTLLLFVLYLFTYI